MAVSFVHPVAHSARNTQEWSFTRLQQRTASRAMRHLRVGREGDHATGRPRRRAAPERHAAARSSIVARPQSTIVTPSVSPKAACRPQPPNRSETAITSSLSPFRSGSQTVSK